LRSYASQSMSPWPWVSGAPKPSGC